MEKHYSTLSIEDHLLQLVVFSLYSDTYNIDISNNRVGMGVVMGYLDNSVMIMQTGDKC